MWFKKKLSRSQACLLVNVEVQRHDLDNDVGSKKQGEAATDALGLDLRLDFSSRPA